MAPYIYARRVADNEFTQRVRRHAPSSLVPLVAQLAATYAMPGAWFESPYKKLTPWALAEVTRVSLLYGNERRQPATADDVMRCCAAYASLGDPDLPKLTLDGFAKFMLRMASEQLGYYQSPFQELARSVALLEETTPGRPLEVLTGNWAEELLGCSVAEYVGVALLFHTGALVNGGVFTYGWLDQINFEPIIKKVAAETITRVAEDHFIATIEEFRALQPPVDARLHPDTRRFAFNPLQARPVISGLASHLLVPVPGIIVKKVSPLGLYYTGARKWGDKFTRDVGSLFEAYVGRNLNVLEGATVHPAIVYGRDKRESVDWIVVFDDVTLLVEVKATRPTENVRTGSDSAEADLRKSLAKAYRQINTTAKLVQGRHADFVAIPPHKPIVGLVVTMEPFHVINAEPYRSLLPSSDIPVRVCDASELEQLVNITDVTAGQFLRTHIEDITKADWSIDTVLDGHSFRRNAVLDQAWKALPWRRADAGDPSL